MAVLGLRFCARAFSSCGKRGPLFIAVRGPLTIAASPAAEHRPQMRRLSNCGSRAQLLRGMRDLPRPGLEPVSPAPAGRLSTTAPPGKPPLVTFLSLLLSCNSFLYILDISPLSRRWFTKIFSHSMGCLFTFFIVSVKGQVYSFDNVRFIYFFSFVDLLLVSYLRKHGLIQHHEDLDLCFLLRVL